MKTDLTHTKKKRKDFIIKIMFVVLERINSICLTVILLTVIMWTPLLAVPAVSQLRPFVPLT